MDVDFVSTVAVVVADPPRARGLFIDALGLPLAGEGDGYYRSESIRGCNHLGLWPLSQAAEACFGMPKWPAERIVFELESAEAVAEAGAELERAGYELLHGARTEPWGQTVARLLSDDGLIVGVSYIPAFHT